jgi:hypothetical protein
LDYHGFLTFKNFWGLHFRSFFCPSSCRIEEAISIEPLILSIEEIRQFRGDTVYGVGVTRASGISQDTGYGIEVAFGNGFTEDLGTDDISK